MHVKHSRQNSQETLSQASDAANDWPPKGFNVEGADELLALRQPSSLQLSQTLSDRHSDADDMHYVIAQPRTGIGIQNIHHPPVEQGQFTRPANLD